MAVTTAVPQQSESRQQPWRGDAMLVTVVVGLLLVGIVAAYTSSYSIGDKFFGDGGYFLKRQLLWTLIGGGAFVVAAAIDYRVWRRYSVLIMAATLLMLIAILATGAARFGGQRWILGTGSVQPSELAKMAVVIYIADWRSSKRDDIRDVTLGLIPFAILMGIVCGLILLQPDFSTAVLVGAVAVAVFFTAGADLKQMVVSCAIAAVVLAGLIVQAPYRLERVRSFVDPTADPTGAGYQIMQTLDSIMRGGVTGVGLGAGQQKHVLPAAHTDAVFAVLGEELGLLGCLVVLALFALFAWRGFRVASGAPDRFGSLLAVGITCWILGQALINIAVVTAFMPFTGIPLPFISFGGSSLVTCMAASGLLVSISRHMDPDRMKAYARMDLGRGNSRSRLSRAHRARSRRA
ncbi:MAG: putative lipid II flippase FtsW [Anaerolineae bacterium]